MLLPTFNWTRFRPATRGAVLCTLALAFLFALESAIGLPADAADAADLGNGVDLALFSAGRGAMLSLECLGWIATLLVVFVLLRRKTRQHEISEKALKDLIASQTAVLDSIPQPVYLRDRELRLLNCNTAYERVAGQSRAQLRTASLEDCAIAFGHVLQIDALQSDYLDVMTTGRAMMKDRTIIIGAKTVSIAHWVEPLRDGAGMTIGIVGSWLDVTERQKALEQLAFARDRAESANRTKSTFLASVSHEIRTPMNAIMGMLELTLSHTDLPAQDQMQLSTAYQAAQSLLSLIDDLLDLSKMEAGKFQFHPVPTDLGKLASEVGDVFRPVALSKSLTLDVTISPQLGAAHQVDPLRVKQILNNFVSNAIRFTQEGGISIEIGAEEPAGDMQAIRLMVSDSGIGIPSGALSTLLEPFVQVQQTRPSSDRGTGLGLSICDRLVKKMGGTLSVSSELNVGTQITAILPLAVVLPVRDLPALKTTHNELGCTVVPLRVLVVDDHAPNLLLLKHQLEKMGHRVECSEHGQHALQILAQQPFDLIICDCAMPVMDGFAFVQALRKHRDGTERLPVLGYTAGAQSGDSERAIAAGMDMVLIKPVGMETLQNAICSVAIARRACTMQCSRPARAALLPS